MPVGAPVVEALSSSLSLAYMRVIPCEIYAMSTAMRTVGSTISSIGTREGVGTLATSKISLVS